MTTRSAIRQLDVTKLIKAAKAAGMNRVEVDIATGRIIATSQDASEPQLTEARDPAERARERRARRWSGDAG